MYYDPLTHQHCGNAEFAKSYWRLGVTLPTDLTPLINQQTFDVAIIGGGFSGLLTAYYLATEHHISCCVIEANQVGFGASARNAGFVLKGSGRLSFQQIAKRWDLTTSKGIYHEFSEGVKRVESLIKTHQIQCEPQEKGYLKIAHTNKALYQLQQQAEFLRNHLKSDCELISKQQLHDQYMTNQQGYGALRLPDGFGLQPLKLLLGYRDMVKNAGVALFEHSTVKHVIDAQNYFELKTDSGSVKAQKVIYNGNAYNNQASYPAINHRYLPILSSIIVTQPLSPQLLASSGLKTHQVTMDTRRLKYYYRLLPDNRLLFGGRGAVFPQQQMHPRYKSSLQKALSDCFPKLSNCNIDYFWSGYIAAALDDMPHINFDGRRGFILGYCGAGVGFSAQAGFRLAQLIAGHTPPVLPLFNQPLPPLPFAKFRRLGQFGYYQYAQFRDHFS